MYTSCPECGTVAAMQEYPTVARMTWRIRMLLAAAWIAALLAGMVITGAIVYAFAQSAMQAIVTPYQSAIQAAWNDHSSKNLTPAQQANWWMGNQGLEQWWQGLPPSKFFAEFGGWGALNWWGLFILTFAAAVLIPVGVVWSVALARLRGWRLLAVLLIPLVFTGLFAIDDFVNVNSVWFFGPQYLVQRQIGWLPLGLSAAACTLFLFAAALAGRPIARTFLRLVLPARLLAAFSFLWIVDGKPLPRPITPHPPRGGCGRDVRRA